MPKRKKPTKAMTIARLKKVQKMSRDLELKLKVIRKDMERLIEHKEHGPK